MTQYFALKIYFIVILSDAQSDSQNSSTQSSNGICGFISTLPAQMSNIRENKQ